MMLTFNGKLACVQAVKINCTFRLIIDQIEKNHLGPDFENQESLKLCLDFENQEFNMENLFGKMSAKNSIGQI